MSLEYAVKLFISILVGGLIFWLLFWLIGQMALPAPFDQAMRMVLFILAVLVVVGFLLRALGNTGPKWPW